MTLNDLYMKDIENALKKNPKSRTGNKKGNLTLIGRNNSLQGSKEHFKIKNRKLR